MGRNLHPPLASALTAFGVDATVKVPSSSAVSASVVWITPLTEGHPTGEELTRAEKRWVMAIAKGEVPSVPRETLVTAPGPFGGAAKVWRVDGTERIEDDHVRVVVVENA